MKRIDYDELPDTLTPSEVARIFRVNAKTVARWAEAGELRSFRTPGQGAGLGHRRYPKDQFREFIAQRNGEAPKD